MDIENPVYPGGYYSLMRNLEHAERPFQNAHLVMPPADVDLAALARQTVTAEPDRPLPEGETDARRKLHALELEFDGDNVLHLLHALTIALLRRRDASEEARQLFLRIWREQGKFLAGTLSVRWMISAATTFGDHGDTIEQRLGGQGLSMLFDLIKLHDSERRQSGRGNDSGFPRVRGAKPRDGLAFDMDPYSLENGDLDINMLARLWRLSEADAVLRPLGFRMLRLVMSDRKTIFARLRRYKRSPITPSH
ncbi:hypothetical protein TRL7639_01556 [Falsiruegeria litorea R37]|uniref:Uncharacterized protein n=1 Tax=Falsiruegeria litorea R37 TaxID=1200284 RepID=A0A1Y5SCB5_9RHOB|nr:hypothetical protein [Falsiruegeria litorea]SLN34362.1 hypothetical protein TRL7639_01556 [Falsiruegeria litorea R37]